MFLHSSLFKVLAVLSFFLFSVLIQTQVIHAASAVSYSTGYSGDYDPCPSSDSYKSSAVSYMRNCTNHGSDDSYGSSATLSYRPGYSYSKEYTNSDTSSDSGKTAIKSEIESLLDRIKALNDQIKNGVPNNDAKPGKTNDIKEVPKTCTVPTETLSFGSKGSGVEQLQNVLSKTGHFKGDSTGYFGEQTREAVRSFQKSQGLVSSGDERSTGYGMVGEKTRGMFKKHCEDTPKARTYGLSDIASVTYTTLTLPGAQNVQLSYEVTLKDGTKRHFVSHSSSTTSMSYSQTEKIVKNTGYTGVIAELLAKAVPVPKPAATNFRLKDVKTVTTTPVDPSTSIADDEYTEYTVTLKDARTITIKGHAGRGTEVTRTKPFRDAGYRGNVETLLKTATPKVLGATTSSVEVLLGEVEEKLTTLRDLF